MSRMRRLKKEKIKATMSGLALMIAIGAAGGVGSYAWFSDQAQAKNDLVITMGDLNNNIENPINIHFDKNSINESKEGCFYIENRGSLNQNVSVRFIKTNNSIDAYLSKIGCKLSIRYVGDDSNKQLYLKDTQISNMSQLLNLNEEVVVVDENNVPVVLNSGDKLEFSLMDVQLTDKSLSTLKGLDGKKVDFGIEANSYQVNHVYSEGGAR